MSKQIQQLVSSLQDAGALLTVENGKLKVNVQKGALDPQTIESIRQHKEALIDYLQQFSQTSNSSPLPTGNNPLLLSAAQTRFWFMDQFEEDRSTYHILSVTRIDGKFDLDIAQQVFELIIERHESLRTGFENQQGKPVAILTENKGFKINYQDISENYNDKGGIKDYICLAEHRDFDLSAPPLMAVDVLKLREHSYAMLITLHHIIADAWSLTNLNKEFCLAYTALTENQAPMLPELKAQYRDYVAWQNQNIDASQQDEQLAFWREELRDLSPVISMPRDHSMQSHVDYAGAKQHFVLPLALSEKIKQQAKQFGVTPNSYFMAAFQWLLSSYARQSDIAVGMAVANRNAKELEPLIGLFLNFLVIRNTVQMHQSFAELVQAVQAKSVAAISHQDTPFERLVDELEIERSLSYLPLTQFNFSFMNTLKGEIKLPGVNIEPQDFESQRAKFELSLNVRESKTGFTCALEYKTSLYEPETIASFIDSFQSLLAWSLDNAQLPMSEFYQPEKLDAWPEHCSGPMLHQLFEKQLLSDPDAIAACYGYTQITYQELEKQANNLANAMHAKGIKPGDCVAIACGRNLSLPVAILATLKAHAVYVPLELDYPLERLSKMVSQANVKAVIVDAETATPDFTAMGLELILQVEQQIQSDQWSDSALQLPSQPGATAYIVFTSGSTGEPKAICMPHSALVNMVVSCSTKLKIETSILQFVATSFDVHCMEIFMAWHQGKQVHFIDANLTKNLYETLSHIDTHEIDTLILPYAVLDQMSQSFDKISHWTSALRNLVSTAGPLPVSDKLVNMFAELKQCKLFDAYGPSETHVVTFKDYDCTVPGWQQNISIGGALDKVSCWVLDGQLNQVPVGAVGELYVAGTNLAHGYWQNPGATAECFVPHPYSQTPGQRLYRTGDLVKRLADGSFKYIERMDDMIKLRGFRIEPAEVEKALIDLASVNQAVVQLEQAVQGQQLLVAYVVRASSEFDEKQLQQSLQKVLPHYMVPGRILFPELLPLTVNGKTDSVALSAMFNEQLSQIQDSQFVEAETAGEIVLHQCWSELLRRPDIGVEDDFFNIGGHSLLATQLVNTLSENIGIDVSVQMVFECATIRQQAVYLSDMMAPESDFNAVCEEYLTLLSMDSEELEALEADLDKAAEL